MNQYICILEKQSLRLAKEITAHSSIPGKFFFPLWKCIMVKLSLIEEKITDAPKSRPHGNLITCGPADATLFTRQRSLQSRPAARWRSILIHSWTESRIEGALSLEGFFFPYPLSLASKPRSWCSNTWADNHGGHRALSRLPFDSTLELDSTSWSESTHILQQFRVSAVCVCGQSEQDTPGETWMKDAKSVKSMMCLLFALSLTHGRTVKLQLLLSTVCYFCWLFIQINSLGC